MSRIVPFITLVDQAEEAAKLYASVFPRSKIISTTGMTTVVELDGQRVVLLNGGAWFADKLREGVSFQVDCDTQAEVDAFTEKLTASGGEVGQCGWIKDRFGLSWQITPNALPRLLSDPDKAKASRVMQAMMKMKKIDIAALERAAAQG